MAEPRARGVLVHVVVVDEHGAAERGSFRFARVPCVGEWVKAGAATATGESYLVERVVQFGWLEHGQPWSSYAAEIIVSRQSEAEFMRNLRP